MLPESTSEEGRILARAASGEPDAVRSLLDLTGPAAYGFVFARVGGNQAAAEDLVQETFLEAMRSSHTFRGEAALRTWIVTIASRRLARYYEGGVRRRRRCPHADRRVDGLAHVTLPLDENTWRTRTNEAVVLRDWHPVAVALDGRIAAIWERGEEPDRRIHAYEEAPEGPAPTELVVWAAAGFGYARLTTARGVPLAGRTVSITVDGTTRQATTDANGVARVDDAPMREIAATFAASGWWSGAPPARHSEAT